MDIHFTTSLQNRKIFYRFLKDTPKDQLFAIPDGFRNNIWWNIAHVISVQQSLLYYWTGVPFRVDKGLIKKYTMGTVPEGVPSDEEFEQVSKALFTSVEHAWEDYQNDRFTEYKGYETANKVKLASIEDALVFNCYHEGLHLGAILGLVKALAGSKNLGTVLPQ